MGSAPVASKRVSRSCGDQQKSITAPATASLEFAKHLLEKLQVFSSPVLDAWYSLYHTGKPEHCFAFIEALKHQAA